MFTLIEKLRKKPLAVRQQIVFLITIVIVMVITVVWSLISFAKYIFPTGEPARAAPEQNIPAGSVFPPSAE